MVQGALWRNKRYLDLRAELLRKELSQRKADAYLKEKMIRNALEHFGMA